MKTNIYNIFLNKIKKSGIFEMLTDCLYILEHYNKYQYVLEEIENNN